MLLRRIVSAQFSNSKQLCAPYSSKCKRETRIWRPTKLPKPGQGQCFRRIVHFKDKYTIEPLEVTNLAGRDPVTGKLICLFDSIY